MTPLSQAYARARTQIPVAPLPLADHGAHLAGASSRFLCLSFFAAAKKVSAAPHRGNANRPLTNQGKAKAPSTQTKSATQAKKSRQLPHPQKPQNRNPMQPNMLTNKPRGDPRTRNNNQITPPTIPKIQRMPRSDPRHAQRIRPIGQQMHDPSTSKPKRRGSINRMPKPMIGTHEQRDPPHTPMRQRTMRNPQPSRA